MNVVRDFLDKQLLDRDKHNLGRVDALVMELREGSQPRIVYFELGAVALSRRLGALGRWLAPRIAGLGNAPIARSREPFRIPWGKVREIEPTNIVVDIDSESSRAHAWERWLRDHVVARLPGGR